MKKQTRKRVQKLNSKYKDHPPEYNGYPFLSLVTIKIGKREASQVGVVFDARDVNGRYKSQISFINLDDAPLEMIEDIEKWDKSIPLNIYLGIKGYNLNRRLSFIPNISIREIVGPIYSPPSSKMVVRRRKRIKPG